MLTVVKCGGAALGAEAFVLERYLERGERAVVVHGAGTHITEALAAAGIASTFVGGRRVTSRRAIPLVREAYRRANLELCRQIGERAHGVLGDDLGLEARRLPELGEVGMLLPIVPPALAELISRGALPVIAPLARGPLNVNADDAAAVLAVALGADRLVFVSDVLVDGEVLPLLAEDEIGALNGSLSGGIVPKLEAAVRAARAGVHVDVGATTVVA
jgi:acetylglutamate kinase